MHRSFHIDCKVVNYTYSNRGDNMAVRTKLNTNEDGTLNGLDTIDELDVVYLEEMKKSGISEDLMAQFMDLSKELDNEKQGNK